MIGTAEGKVIPMGCFWESDDLYGIEEVTLI